jgi:hypothetical protein
MNAYSFNSVVSHIEVRNGVAHEVTEAVSVKNGEGTKTVITREGGRPKKSEHRLTAKEIRNIKGRKFMPALFDVCYTGLGDCHVNRQREKRKMRKTLKRR